MTRISAFERLKSLPEVFTTRSLPGLLGTDRKSASVCLARWRKRGFISSLGPQAGVHFNLVLNPQAERERHMDAIAHLLPGARMAGVTALWMEGWTTQYPRRAEIMVPARPSFPKLHGGGAAFASARLVQGGQGPCLGSRTCPQARAYLRAGRLLGQRTLASGSGRHRVGSRRQDGTRARLRPVRTGPSGGLDVRPVLHP